MTAIRPDAFVSATPDEVLRTVAAGERFDAKYGRTGLRRNFLFGGIWRGRQYETKQVEAYAVFEDDDWLVPNAVTKYF